MSFRRIYAIPDLHGRSDLLDMALHGMDAEGMDLNQDLLVFLGDMIDRGPDSKGVLDTVMLLQKDHPKNVVVLRGNHEDLALDFYVRHRPHSKDAWYMNGGVNTEMSYPNRQMSREHIGFLNFLPYHYEAQGFFFSHAPVPRQKARRDFSTYSQNELTWTYMGPECDKKDGLFSKHEGPLSQVGLGSENLTGVCGHIHRGKAVKEVRIFPKYRMLDCGAGCWESAPLAVHECISGDTKYYSYFEAPKAPNMFREEE
jgi:hypothetical protein